MVKRLDKPWRGHFSFRVAEGDHGEPWITFDAETPPGDEIPKGGFGFDLPKDLPLSEAEKIADFMNKHLGDFLFTPYAET